MSIFLEFDPSNNSLEEVAQMLNVQLGGIQMARDTSGRYEEYPAYVSKFMGGDLILLGVPDPEYDIRDEKVHSFEIQAWNLNDNESCDENEILKNLKKIVVESLKMKILGSS